MASGHQLPGGWLSLFNPPHTDWIWHHCVIYHHCNKVLRASRSYPMEKVLMLQKKYLTSVRRFSGDVRYCEIWGDFHSLAWEINFQLERLWFHDFAHLDFGAGLWWEMSLAVCLPGQSVCSRAVKSPVLPELSPACPALGSVCSTRERLHSCSWPWHQWAQESLK